MSAMDVCNRLLSLGRRHLVSAYEVKPGMVYFAGETCDPCLSALSVRYYNKGTI